MRRAAVILLLIPLGGCMADQTKTFAACQFPMARQFGKQQALEGGEVEICMKVHGYKLQISKYCPYGAISEIKLLCYQPNTWLGQIGYKIEMALRSNKEREDIYGRRRPDVGAHDRGPLGQYPCRSASTRNSLACVMG
jgi:hypothetical protein